jgi:hypothetical protein
VHLSATSGLTKGILQRSFGLAGNREDELGGGPGEIGLGSPPGTWGQWAFFSGPIPGRADAFHRPREGHRVPCDQRMLRKQVPRAPRGTLFGKAESLSPFRCGGTATLALLMVTTADWEAVQAETAALYEEGRFAEGMERTREAAGGFPERAARLTYRQACLLRRTGDPDQALMLLLEGYLEACGGPNSSEAIPISLQSETDRRSRRSRKIRPTAPGPQERGRSSQSLPLTPGGGASEAGIALHTYGVSAEETARH